MHSDRAKEFLHNANNKQEEGDDIDKSLHDIGKDCLDLIFAAFCNKSESYKMRRWVIHTSCVEGLRIKVLTMFRLVSWFMSLPLTVRTI